MSAPANTRSFRIRLALQTMIVAGTLVAGFGAAAWWYASRTLERSVDDRIIAPAQRVWNRIDPYTTDDQFKLIADLVFGTSAEPSEAHSVLVVQEHAQGKTIFATPNSPKDLDVYFRSCFPTQEEIGRAPPGGGPGPPGGRRREPPPPRRENDFDDMLGTPGFGRPPPPQQERELPFRPQMPMVREPTTFTARSGGVDWRFGAFSSPTYTIFIGLSLTDFYAEINRMAWWYVGTGALGLVLAGFGALWTSRQAMRPLERVVSTAQRLTASDLAERIPVQRDDNREFAQLIDVLNGMMQRLEGSFQQAIRFTADASHELKTPLAIMLADLDDAVRHAAPGSTEHERFVSLFAEASRLKQITQSLLLLSQADAGRLPTHPESYNLSIDLERLIEDGEILCEQAGLTLEHHIEPSITTHADRALLQQVFQNLLSNAIKYNRPQGRVSLRLSKQDAQIVFTVTNTGPAIRAENQQRLFERFFRGDQAHTRKTDGFGLGLNIATELARANGAELRLVSSKEDETVFEVRMAAQE
ncbi:MAG: HAMP domain-containing protein [Prosthecobacter sp.]|uniref:sensor histidine kinase n=1 Tax=Prosthecobacter sp. TaxID=1965333 RepID=UPI0025E9DE09|nr:ATP-binding protein [Prosthecobacter sp.]MCF7787976.1 HAMP domain-containing protein [Prosthecobacter sp.]